MASGVENASLLATRRIARKRTHTVCSPAMTHAIHALVSLAKTKGRYVDQVEIANSIGLSPTSAYPILYKLQKHGLLCSRKGPGGGYMLAQSPDKLTLLAIWHAVDTDRCFNCAMGYTACSKSEPCLMHETWTQLRSSMEEYMRAVTIRQLADSTASDAPRRTRAEETFDCDVHC